MPCAISHPLRANKGFAASEHLSLYTQGPPGASGGATTTTIAATWRGHPFDARRWHGAILGYANCTGPRHACRHGHLAAYACGACYACRAKPPRRHGREGGRVHLVELLPATRGLLRHVVHTVGASAYVTIHDVGGSNVSRMIDAPDSFFTGEAGSEVASLLPWTRGAERLVACDGRTDLLQGFSQLPPSRHHHATGRGLKEPDRTCKQFSQAPSRCLAHQAGRHPCNYQAPMLKRADNSRSAKPTSPACYRDTRRICRRRGKLRLTTVDDLMAASGA